MHNPNDSNSISNNYILSLQVDSRGIVWVGTKGGGLNSVDSAGNIRRFYNPSSPESNNINCIIDDNSNNSFLWLGTENGLFRFEKSTGGFISYPIENNAFLGNNGPVSG